MKSPRKNVFAVLSTVAMTGLASATFAEESALATAGLLKMDIMVNCQDGNAVFRIKNVGDAWPKTSIFAIYNMRKKGNKRLRKLISKRRMRLKVGQKASFKIKTYQLPSGRVGLWVKPGWYKRDFNYATTVRCSRPQGRSAPGS